MANPSLELQSATNLKDQPCELYPTFASNFIALLSIESGIYYITTYYNGVNFDICTGTYSQKNDVVSCPFNNWIDLFIQKTMESSFNERCFGDDSLTNSISFTEKQKMTEKQQGNTAGINIWFFVSFVLFFIVLAQAIVISVKSQQKIQTTQEYSRESKSVRSSSQTEHLLRKSGQKEDTSEHLVLKDTLDS